MYEHGRAALPFPHGGKPNRMFDSQLPFPSRVILAYTMWMFAESHCFGTD